MDNKTKEKYIEKFMKKKTGEEKIKITSRLAELDFDIARIEIRAQNPNIPPKDLTRLVYERIYGSKCPF